jgi:hypothetical protein
MSLEQLQKLGDEIRDVLCNLMATRTAHFASNLGVVELCLALHSVYDFRTDRLIWDTGHQIYPHKLITGRYHEFSTIRTRGGLMGYPNPAENNVNISFTWNKPQTVFDLKIIDLNGKLIHADRHTVFTGNNLIVKHLIGYESGLYKFILCFEEDVIETITFVKN